MKINILNDIPLDMPFFHEEEIEWLTKHFTIMDSVLIIQTTTVVEEATDWLTHILHAASMGRVGWKEHEGCIDIFITKEKAK